MGNNTSSTLPPRLSAGHSVRDLAGGGSPSEDGGGVTLVHANVPNGTLEALGVPTLLSRMLEAEELDYSFGQTDSLTDRLHALLVEYSDGFAVPKELVQNADDAGATEIRSLQGYGSLFCFVFKREEVMQAN